MQRKFYEINNSSETITVSTYTARIQKQQGTMMLLKKNLRVDAPSNSEKVASLLSGRSQKDP